MRSTVLAVTTEPASISVNGFCARAAPTVLEMYTVLGKPSRIDAGETPAPVGHRNNQIHVFDELGVTFNEHHYTRLVQEIACWFNTKDPEYRFTPKNDFGGQLICDGVVLPLSGEVRKFLSAAPWVFEGGFGGAWQYRFGGLSVFVSSRGPKLPSGRRSKIREIVSVSFSFSHDCWQEPTSSVE
jgi:hypothetical protein